MAADQAQIEMDGHRFKLTNLAKVLYPETGTTKADVISYYATVGPTMLPHLYERPATRFVASFVGSPPMNVLEGSERIVVNGGTSTYAAGEDRARERSTAAARVASGR